MCDRQVRGRHGRAGLKLRSLSNTLMCFHIVICSGGVIGSHRRLKISRRKACRFDSGLEHHFGPIVYRLGHRPFTSVRRGSIPPGTTILEGILAACRTQLASTCSGSVLNDRHASLRKNVPASLDTPAPEDEKWCDNHGRYCSSLKQRWQYDNGTRREVGGGRA